MTQRILYIAAYDIANPRRLSAALKILKSVASGRQKSVFECFLTNAERDHVLRKITAVLDMDEDRFLLAKIEPRGKFRTLGRGVKPVNSSWLYIG